jgi:lipopolysaccharide transport system permease protein
MSSGKDLPPVRMVKAIVRNRWLLYTLVARDLKLRYRGSLIGFFWTLLNPLAFMGIYTLVFSRFLRFDIPYYHLFLLSALMPWLWFNEAVSSGTHSILNGGGFIKSGIFPSQILPVASVTSAMMNFLFALPLVLLFLGLSHIHLGWSLLALPVIMVVQFVLTLGIVLLLATYNVFFRDLQQIVGHALLALFFLTPVFYDWSKVPDWLEGYLELNPLSVMILSYRYVLFLGEFPKWDNLGLLALLALAIFCIGCWAFERNREVFAEYL